MLKGLYTSYTGMINEQNRMDVITNNLANIATNGYKKEGATSQSFDEVLAYKIRDKSEALNIPRKLGNISPGVKIGENYTDYSQGSFRITNNPYDMAISGKGFFQVEFTNKENEKSIKFTRDGSFTLNKEGFVVTEDGDYLLGSNDEYIKVDPLKPSSIDESGRIMQGDKVIATVKVVDFEDYDYIEHYGENMYQPVEGATQKEANAKIYSGYVEASNVAAVTEMVSMISLYRTYEANQKLIQTYDDSLNISVNQIGKV